MVGADGYVAAGDDDANVSVWGGDGGYAGVDGWDVVS